MLLINTVIRFPRDSKKIAISRTTSRATPESSAGRGLGSLGV